MQYNLIKKIKKKIPKNCFFSAFALSAVEVILFVLMTSKQTAQD